MVYTDGACRGNPGVSSAGWYIVDAVGGDIERGGEYLGHGTNNEAEYRAAILGLEAVVRHGAQEVTLRSDSELMVRQLTGIYRVKKANIRPLFTRVKELLGGFERFVVEHVYREDNRIADALANQHLDAALARRN